MKFLLSILSMEQLDLVMCEISGLNLFLLVNITNLSSYQEEIF